LKSYFILFSVGKCFKTKKESNQVKQETQTKQRREEKRREQEQEHTQQEVSILAVFVMTRRMAYPPHRDNDPPV
jgi:uncharacterized ion transporter superfamily protein YfcC